MITWGSLVNLVVFVLLTGFSLACVVEAVKLIRTNPARAIVSFVLAAAFAWYPGYLLVHDEYRQFRPHLDQYVGLRATATPGQCELDTCAYVRGKVLLIDEARGDDRSLPVDTSSASYTFSDGGISPLQQSVDASLAPAVPAEIGTIVWLSWTKTPTASYEGGAKAYRVDCEVTIYDLEKRERVRSRVFEGKAPDAPPKVTRSFDGEPPVQPIVDYLSSRRRIQLGR